MTADVDLLGLGAADPAAGLTRRIRAAVLADLPAGLWEDPVPEVPVVPARRWWRTARADPRRGRRRWTSVPRQARRPTVLGGMLGTVLVVLVVGWVVAGRAPGPAQDPPARSTSVPPSVPTVRAAAPTAPRQRSTSRVGGPAAPSGTRSDGTGATGTGVTAATPTPRVGGAGPPLPGGSRPPRDPAISDPAAPDRRPRALVEALTRARARAWNATDPGLLGTLDAPGSPALAGDRRALRAARDAGLRYAGVGLAVTRARLLRRGPGRATISATVDAGAYRVVRGRTVVESRPGRAGASVVLDLLWTPRGWRVAEVADGAPE